MYVYDKIYIYYLLLRWKKVRQCFSFTNAVLNFFFVDEKEK